MKRFVMLICIYAGFSTCLPAQKKADVYLDDSGVMRWPDGGEVYGFGVNYTVPFAHAYRSAIRMGVEPKKAIDDDVYHFARLGFDAFRVHVWDTEISDTLGNLLENEHLEIFDYMLNEMKKRGMKFILTPIAFWGNGWPERDEQTPGFSYKYGKSACLTNENAIRAQENYLSQFIRHVNPYTGIAYKEDPDIVAFEISNEPHHDEEPEKVTAYITRLVESMRATGCVKPIFYNVSHSIHLARAYFDAPIQGGTFQWYPTGLGFQKELQGNMLPNVDLYAIPFDEIIKSSGSARMVYEFDAADVGSSYIYPAMARSFRTAGIQWATHFSYDPTFLAHVNTEYNTHFMNLVYAPQKALSLKIAAEVFHNLPMGSDFGRYPANTTFGAFHVSYENDLAEMVTDEKFFYTNHTASAPESDSILTEIAGFGNSPIVSYDGLGAYFLDKMEQGVWRLEVMPDAIWIDNLFGRNSPNTTRAVINRREWPMTVHLSDLGGNFTITALMEGNNYRAEANGGQFNIFPGVYLLVKKGAKTSVKGTDAWKNIRIGEFVAPGSTVGETLVLHSPEQALNAGEPWNLSATVVAVDRPKSVSAWVLSGFRGKKYEMQNLAGYTYTTTIPAEEMINGFLKYYILVDDGKTTRTFPGALAKQPSDWDFTGSAPFEVKVLDVADPVYVFDALADAEYINAPWNRGLRLKPVAEPGKAVYEVNIQSLHFTDPENRQGEKIHDYSMRIYIGDKVSGRMSSVSTVSELVFSGYSLNEKACPLQVALVTKDGEAYGAVIHLLPEFAEYKIPLTELKQVKLVTLPRPYPTFLPYFFEGGKNTGLTMEKIESLQISIGPGINTGQLADQHGVAVRSIRLQ